MAMASDYLVSDYLAEITMALLARSRAKNPDAGYVPDVVQSLTPILADIHSRDIKVITNGGALNPRACAQALQEAADAAELPLRVAAIEGDDLTPSLDAILATGPTDMATGEAIPAKLSSVNAYLGARPIAQALDQGADIVITGRCARFLQFVVGPADARVRLERRRLRPARRRDAGRAHHRVRAAMHGSVHTDWRAVPGWDDIGYPIAEVRRDGTAVITKPPGTGGLVSVGTVGEQILFEIGDPAGFITPDVVCDWRDVTLEQVGPDRVQVSGARGTAATTSYKVARYEPRRLSCDGDRDVRGHRGGRTRASCRRGAREQDGAPHRRGGLRAAD